MLRQATTDKNPILIFAEMDHSDPITFEILTELLPKLKDDLDYECCFLEYFPGTLQEHIKDVKEQITHGKTIRASIGMTDSGNSESDIDLYYHIFSGPGLKLNKNDVTIYTVLAYYYTANLSRLIFLENLASHNMSYRGIDSSSTGIIENEVSPDTIKGRDKEMAAAYISAAKSSKSVFGKIGAGHLEGIQDEILKAIPDKSAASEQFCFFSIYSKTALSKKTVTAPLSYISLDARQHSKDQIIQIILQEISRKKSLLNKKSQKPDCTVASARDAFFTQPESKTQSAPTVSVVPRENSRDQSWLSNLTLSFLNQPARIAENNLPQLQPLDLTKKAAI